MAKGKDADTASVRVDFGDGSSAPETPAEAPDGSGPPIWLIGVAALVLIGVVFLLLRPAENEAADGTIREAPTTTVVAEVESTESIEQEEAPDLAFPDSAVLIPTPIDSELIPTSIIEDEVGFLGLVSGTSTAPTIVRSIDGESWRTVETTATSAGIDTEIERRWTQLKSFQGQLQVFGSGLATDPVVFKNDVFVSPDGASWAQVEGIGSLSLIHI